VLRNAKQKGKTQAPCRNHDTTTRVEHYNTFSLAMIKTINALYIQMELNIISYLQFSNV